MNCLSSIIYIFYVFQNAIAHLINVDPTANVIQNAIAVPKKVVIKKKVDAVRKNLSEFNTGKYF